MSRDYKLSRAARDQRRAASARAAAVRAPGREWKTVRVPADLAARIEAERAANGDDAAWRVIERALLVV